MPATIEMMIEERRALEEEIKQRCANNEDVKGLQEALAHVVDKIDRARSLIAESRLLRG